MKRFLSSLLLKIRSFFFPKSDTQPVTHAPISDLGYTVTFGDVLFCTMPLSEKELESIGIHHRNRPYLVAEVLENGVLAFYGTSKKKTKNDTNHKWFRHCFERPIYKINDSGNKQPLYYTYFNIAEKIFIPTENILYLQYSLSSSEKQDVIRKNRASAKGKDRLHIKPYLQKGDVVQKNAKQWYIHQSTLDTLYVYPFLKESISDTCVTVHLPLTSRIKYVDCGTSFSFLRNEVNTTLLTLDPKEIGIIDTKKRELSKNKSFKEDFPKTIFFLYPFGEILYDVRWGTRFIYLYSIRRADYVIDLFHSSSEEFEIIDMNYAKQLEPQGLEDEDTLYAIINAFYEVNPAIHAIASCIATEDDYLQLNLIQSACRNNADLLERINAEYNILKDTMVLPINERIPQEQYETIERNMA